VNTHVLIVVFILQVQNIALKTFSIALFLSTDLFYIYIYYWNFSGEFNKIIKTVDHRARLLEK